MIRFIVCCMEGASASSRRDSKTISATLEPILADWMRVQNPHSFHLAYKEYKSNFITFPITRATRFVTKQIKKGLKKGDQVGVFFLGKSLGGEKIANQVIRRVVDRTGNFNGVHRVGMVFVDPHGYGHGQYKPIEIPELWIKDNRRVHGFYQHNKFPTGAKLDFGTHHQNNSCEELPQCDHWNIISDVRVKHKIKDTIAWVTGV